VLFRSFSICSKKDQIKYHESDYLGLTSKKGDGSSRTFIELQSWRTSDWGW
jgi:hypothetical protein